MTSPLQRPASPDGLFLWIMHRFAEEFHEHAVLRGGMAMRLIDSPRSTTDIDYVFVPYESKKDIRKQIEAVLAEIEDAEITIDLHSKLLRAESDSTMQPSSWKSLLLFIAPPAPSPPVASQKALASQPTSFES